MIDRAVNTIVKDVILKGFVIVYEDVSPTRNRKAAMKKMTIAGEFIAKNGLTMPEQSLGELEALYNELVQLQPSVTTGWRDLISHPVKTYTNARDFRKGAGKLLDDAITASSKGNFQRVRNARKHAEDAVQQIHGASSEGASNDNVNVPAAQENAVAAATATLSTPPSAHLDTGVGGDSSPIAYLRFRDSDVTFGPNTRAKLEFNGETFTMVLFPNHSSRPAAEVDQPARTVRRTASVFTATGTARIVSQPQHTSSDESSQDDGDDSLSVCMLEWLDGPVLTALIDDEGTTDSGSDTD